MKKLPAAIILTSLFMGVNLPAQTPPAPSSSDVPIKEVVLFSSGVGYFQHEGSVQGDADTELRFKTSQINDILKSLVLQDLDGGRVGVVTYPSQDPLEKTLGSFQVDLSDHPSFGEMLSKLRGARITLAYTGPGGIENFPGTILGVEERGVEGSKSDDQPFKKAFLNLVTDRGIRSLELDRVDKLVLDDPGLQEELNRALAAVAGARDQDKKPVEIHFNGQGERKVRIGYVVETPIWRASYRLVLPSADAGKKGLLQGWAIVENQTDNDWKDVKLSLVSGRPVSFIEDLYQPLYVPRPTVVPELYASLKPQEYAGGQAEEAVSASTTVTTGSNIPTSEEVSDAPAGNTVTKDKNIRRRGFTYPTQFQPPAVAAAPAPFNPSESVAPLSDASKVGELFQYTVGNVSLPRQTSAMIPIINDPVEVEKLSIYNDSVLAKHPLNGARLKNTTADQKHLLQGPVTVFDEGRYAGDARLDDVPPGQTRLLSYGIDLQTSAQVKNLENQQSIQTGKIVKGVLQVTRKAVSAKEYSVENKSDHDKTLVIEHPVRQGWKLVETLAPIETTDALYRFQQNLAAGKTDKFTVKEENIQTQTLALVPLRVEDVQFYSQAGEIPPAVRDALGKAVKLKQEVADTQRQISDRDAQIKTFGDDQNRIRENLKSVDKASAYATRLLKKLDDQESQLDKLRQEADTFRTKLNDQNRALADYLNSLSVG